MVKKKTIKKTATRRITSSNKSFKKTSSKVHMSKSEYLSSIVNLHINHQVILAEKTAFLVAVSALILTIVLSALFNSSIQNIPLLIKSGLVLLAMGSAFSIIMSISVEMINPVKKVSSFHPLSLEEFHDEAKETFYKDLLKTCKSEKSMVEDFSNQILEMKEDIYKKTSKISVAIYCLTVPLFVMTILACIQMYLLLF